MANEAKVQRKLINYLKEKDCYVIKTKPGPGTPVGCPDVIALYRGGFLAIEVKADSKSPYGPLQEDTLALLATMGRAITIHSENYDEIIQELENIL